MLPRPIYKTASPKESAKINFVNEFPFGVGQKTKREMIIRLQRETYIFFK